MSKTKKRRRQARFRTLLEMWNHLVESHSIADFPHLMANTMNRALQRGYDSYPDEWRRIVDIVDVADFREHEVIRVSETEDLVQIEPGGEYELSSFVTESEKYRVYKFGRAFSITWETIVNDDLDQIRRQPQRFGRAAARLLNKLIWRDILEANPLMADGKPVFHQDHGNLITEGFGSEGLQRALTAMRKQTDMKGNPIWVRPRYLIHPVDLEFQAKVVLNSTLVPGSGDNDVNVLRGILEPIMTPELTDPKSWYVFASPSDIDTIRVAFLRTTGRRPQLFVKSADAMFLGGGRVDPVGQGDFQFDEVQYKVRYVTGAKPIDYRGMLKSQVS